ncbi:MAG: hypothetical protein KKG09_10905 [Verrucomicrobia bacterium]|nr:hypothetical protein [Verrucomicrobiota bacterium]MCG2680236.1 hypothetical protein [Kiritimatiellia bacterium]MBU4247671.1 hypothetical protein [Verrucomicrobiota bacterium]MBU4289799.1 hypothetical protein [Verrucomicrobiota bacterium]MBU4428058.1 hypothetical protein [Verrucomicrobiota bacterium]
MTTSRTGEGKFFIRRKVLPYHLGEKRAWFRMFWVLGRVIPCWWDDLTHVYQAVSKEEERGYALQRLSAITALVAKVSRMNLSATEIAVDEDGERSDVTPI